MTQPVQQYGWLKTLLGSLTNIAAGIAGVFGGPPAALATSILGNAIVNPAAIGLCRRAHFRVRCHSVGRRARIGSSLR